MSQASQSIAKQQHKPNPGLFASLSKVQPAGAPVVKVTTVESGIPYIGFDSEKGGNHTDLVMKYGKAVTAGFIHYNGPGGLQHVDPFRFHLMQCEQFWVQRADVKPFGAIKATKTRQTDWKSPLKESVEAIIVAYINDVPTPCITSFRGGVAAMVSSSGGPCDVLNAFNDPDAFAKWVLLSPDHKFAASIPSPSFRFVVNGTTRPAPLKSGGLFAKGDSVVVPTTAAQVAAVAQAIESPGFQELYKQVQSAYDNRVKELNDLCAKGV